MKRITVPETLRGCQWVCTQTYFCSGKMVKEFYKFDGETPIDRIFVSCNKELPVSDEVITKCLDEVVDSWLQCCFIGNDGHTHTIINSYEHIATEYGVETSLTFGTQYYLK